MTTPLSGSNVRNTLSLFGRSLSEAEDKYIRELTMYNMTLLEKEPERLKKELAKVSKEKEDIAIKNYSIFIDAAKSVASTSKGTVDMTVIVDKLLAQLPVLLTKCKEFTEEASKMEKDANLTQVISDHSVLLVELMEIPQLMDTCLKNDMIEQALDLHDFVVSLSARYPTVQIFCIIQNQMDITRQIIIAHLFAQLRGPLSLSSCVRVISYLRRMNVFTLEEDLRTAFLAHRAEYMDEVVKTMAANAQTSTQAYEYLRQILDLNKSHIFDVVTQFRAIFVDSNTVPSSSSSTSLAAVSVSLDQGPLFIWVYTRVEALLETLGRVLPFVHEGTSFNHILEQSMYCGYALSKIGVDFRGLLAPIFEDAIFTAFVNQMQHACLQFKEHLDMYDMYLDTAQLNKFGIVSMSKDSLLTPPSSSSSSSPASTMPSLSTPIVSMSTLSDNILHFPALANFANAFIAAYNRLRGCAPLSLSPSIAKASTSAISTISKELVAVYKQRKNAASKNGSDSSTRASAAQHSSASSLSASTTSRDIGTLAALDKGIESEKDFSLLAKSILHDLVPFVNNIFLTVYPTPSGGIFTELSELRMFNGSVGKRNVATVHGLCDTDIRETIMPIYVEFSKPEVSVLGESVLEEQGGRGT